MYIKSKNTGNGDGRVHTWHINQNPKIVVVVVVKYVHKQLTYIYRVLVMVITNDIYGIFLDMVVK